MTDETTEQRIASLIDQTDGLAHQIPVSVATRLAEATGTSEVQYLDVSALEDPPRAVVVVVTPRSVLRQTTHTDLSGSVLQIWSRRDIQRVEVTDSITITGRDNDGRRTGQLDPRPSATIYFSDGKYIRFTAGYNSLPDFRTVLVSLASD